MKTNSHKGMSLVELVIVIAIIAILSVGGVLAFNKLHFANTENAMQEIVSALDKLQVDSMSKSNPEYLYIYKSDNSYYWKRFPDEVSDSNVLDENGRKIGSDSIAITMDGVNLDDTHWICIRYDRSGAYGDKTNVSKIGISGNYTIQLVKASGKHIVD